MKRAVSFILSLILLLSSGAFAATADSTADLTDYTKITPALAQSIANLPVDPEPGDYIEAIVYFTDSFASVDAMPSFPEYRCLDEYTEYVIETNKAIIGSIFSKLETGDLEFFIRHYVNTCLPGCAVIYDFDPDLLPALERSGHVKTIDLFDYSAAPGGAFGKYNKLLQDILPVFGGDEYITLWIHNSRHMKSMDDMPSWAMNKEGYEKAREEYSVYQKDFEEEFERNALDGIDAYIITGNYGFMLGAAVKVSDLEKLASRRCVRDITYLENPICYPDEEMPIDIDDTLPDITYRKYRLCAQYDYKDSNKVDYNELYVHKYTEKNVDDPDDWDTRESADWILVEASLREQTVCCVLHTEVIGGRMLTASAYPYRPFLFTYGIYDARSDRFYDLTEIDFDDYDGLYDVWQSIDIDEALCRIYKGDADGDGEVSILDATKIQRTLARLCSRNELAAANADVDSDGEITILDATRIRRYKADLCDINGSDYIA